MSLPSPPAFLDTAIPMYAPGTPHPYRDACQWLITEIANGRLQVVIDAEVIQEILHGLVHIISSDLHFELIAGLTRLDPIVLHQTASQSTP